jgi:hypothetical protein
MKTLNDYQLDKVNYLRGKLAYHRGMMETAPPTKTEYHQRKVAYALSKLTYMGYSEEGEGEE